MAGTKSGGQAAAAANKARYGEDFYAKIGSLGGKKSRNGGFAANRELARLAGSLGGSMSKRRKYLSDSHKAQQRQKFDHAYRHLMKVAETARRNRKLELAK